MWQDFELYGLNAGVCIVWTKNHCRDISFCEFSKLYFYKVICDLKVSVNFVLSISDRYCLNLLVLGNKQLALSLRQLLKIITFNFIYLLKINSKSEERFFSPFLGISALVVENGFLFLYLAIIGNISQPFWSLDF